MRSILTGWARLALLVPAIALLAIVAARAQSGDTPLRVGVLPIVDVAPLYLGMEKGFFKDEHLAIEPVTAQGGGAVAAAVISGDEQIGYGNVVSMILAAAHGLPLEAVNDGSQSIADGHHANVEMITLADGPIKTMRDFEGKVVAVNALKTMSELIVRDDLERHGVDTANIKFVEMPIPEMVSALKTGRVDVALQAEPFLTAEKSDDVRFLFEPYDAYAPKITLATYFATHQYVTDHPDVIARFRRAMLKSLAYATANPEEARRIIPSYTKIEATTAANMALVGWGSAIDMPSVVALQKSMLKYGWIGQEVDLKAMFPAAAVAGK